MKKIIIFILLLSLTVYWFYNNNLKQIDAIFIVKEEGVLAIGNVGYILDPDNFGKMVPDLWKPGNIVFFKVNGIFGDKSGEAGILYKIMKNKKLKKIGNEDVNIKDLAIAKQFGIKKNNIFLGMRKKWRKYVLIVAMKDRQPILPLSMNVLNVKLYMQKQKKEDKLSQK